MAIQDYYMAFYLQEYTGADDGFGGETKKFGDGAETRGLYRQASSDRMMIAEAQGVTSRGEYITDIDAPVSVGDILRRESDGIYIKIVGIAVLSPAQAKTQIKKMTAELAERDDNPP